MKLVRVESMPEVLEPDTLYVSHKYQLAIHLCPCAICAKLSWQMRQAVTPLVPGEWTCIIDNDNAATLSPSILNRGCNAHYWIRDGQVVWT